MTIFERTVWWHVYPLGATGAPIRADQPGYARDRVVHRLGRLEGWLDYAGRLGCTGLLLGPVFASVSHGYDTLDHFRIDARLGDDADFDHLVAAARGRGMPVVLDGVFNHVSREHRLARDAGAAWEGHDELIELDHDDPQVHDLVVDVMRHWLARGAAGWRLDVAYAVPTDFWRAVLARVRTEYPDAIFIGEVIHGDYAEIAAAATLDSVTQYELWKAIWSSLADRNLWELAWTLERHDAFSQSLLMQTFVGNHDVDRIASVVGDDGSAVAHAILMTVPGMPSIYYGDEQAFRGQKGSGFAADDPVRPPLPDDPGALAAAGGWMYELLRRLIAIRAEHAWLARARLDVLTKTNTSISYECRGDGHVLRTDIDLDAPHQVQIVVDDRPVLRWPG